MTANLLKKVVMKSKTFVSVASAFFSLNFTGQYNIFMLLQTSAEM